MNEREERRNTNQHYCTLKRHMAKQGITQKGFSVDTGLSISTISRIVRGVMWPDIYTALRLARILGVDVTEIWHID